MVIFFNALIFYLPLDLLVEGNTLGDSTINTVQKILMIQFPLISGFQNTLLGQKLQFKPVIVKDFAVQVLHTG